MKRVLAWLQGLRKNLSILRGNLLILTLSWMVLYPALRMLEPYDKLYIEDLGATPPIIGLIAALSTVVVAFIRIPGGYIADRFGRKRISVTMTFIMALAYVFYAFAPSWEWILIGTLISSFSLIYQPALMAMRADSVPPGKRGTGFALADFLPMLVSIPAPIISGYLVSTMGRIDGVRLAYLVAIGMGLTGAFTRLLLKETLPERKPETDTGNFSGFREDFKRQNLDATKFVFKVLPHLILIYVIFEFGFTGCYWFFQIFAVNFLGISDGDWGVVYMLSLIVYLGTVVPIGVLVDKVGRRKLMLTLTGIVCFSCFLFASTPKGSKYTLTYVLVAFPMLMLANVTMFNVFPVLEADLVPREKRGRVSAILFLLSGIAGAAGQVLAGFAYERIHPRVPFLLLAALIVVDLVLIVSLVKEPREKEL
jgi:DHA1 family tetracycline resistance protein-like MFS transporter